VQLFKLVRPKAHSECIDWCTSGDAQNLTTDLVPRWKDVCEPADQHDDSARQEDEDEEEEEEGGGRDRTYQCCSPDRSAAVHVQQLYLDSIKVRPQSYHSVRRQQM
jgi:hypothetical protein